MGDDVRRAALIILDGAGYSPQSHGNGVTAESLPHVFQAMEASGFAQLEACGEAVGLEAGQVGNSEVGHLTIGAGRTVLSMTRRLAAAHADGSWSADPTWKDFGEGNEGGGCLHLVGAISDAGVHALARTMIHAAQIAAKHGVTEVVLHPILDGVDSRAGTAPEILEDVKQQLAPLVESGVLRFGVVMGRKWFCDRSGNLDLTRVATSALCGGRELPAFDPAALAAHVETESEMSFEATLHEGGRTIAPGEPVLITHHRADRVRQVIQVLGETQPMYTIMDPGEGVDVEHTFFPLQIVTGGLATIFNQEGIESVRVAEKCKFPHVTFFLNGFDTGAEGEGICLPSIAEHEIAEKPEMSLAAVTDTIVEALEDPNRRALVANLCNLDQVGHLGRIDLAEVAASHVDAAFQRICEVGAANGWTLLFTSDHGCADRVLTDDGKPFGSHTDRPVPFFAIAASGIEAEWQQREGSLVNVAATFLDALGIAIPDSMEAPLLRFHGAPAS